MARNLLYLERFSTGLLESCQQTRALLGKVLSGEMRSAPRQREMGG